MAESNYARLSCRGCGVPVLPTVNKDGSLRKNQSQACSSKCLKRKLSGISAIGRRCKNCGDDIEALPLNRAHCSAACRRQWAEAQKRERRGRSPFEWQQERACVACGAAYMPRHKVSMYCSKRCKHDAAPSALRHRAAVEANALVRAARQAQKQAELQRAKDQRAIKVATVKGKASRSCPMCCVEFCPFGKAFKYCSDECSAIGPREAKRAARSARKALERARTVERVIHRKVFERDGWKCYLCGCSTPKSKRGSYDDDAPELEHVVPLSRGGEHSYANARCACRRCNLIKGDHLLEELGGEYIGGGAILTGEVSAS